MTEKDIQKCLSIKLKYNLLQLKFFQDTMLLKHIFFAQQKRLHKNLMEESDISYKITGCQENFVVILSKTKKPYSAHIRHLYFNSLKYVMLTCYFPEIILFTVNPMKQLCGISLQEVGGNRICILFLFFF